MRSRIKSFRYVEARDFKASRREPPASVSKILETNLLMRRIGMFDALLARELPDGTLELLDGELRASLSDGERVPVLIVDLDETEAEAVRKLFRYRRGRRPNYAKLLEHK